MRWARIIGISLISLSGPALAQSIDQGVRGLEACFETARLADTICDKQTDPEQRLNCFEKTRAAQLECLKHVLPDKSATSPEAVPPAPPPSASSEAPQEVTPTEIPSTSPSNVATEKNSQDTASKADAKVDAPEIPPTREEPTATILPDTKSTAQPAAPPLAKPATREEPTATILPDTKSIAQPAAPPLTKPATREEPTATILSDTNSIAKPGAPPLTKKDWIVSETTSPIDFSALVIAVIQPVQQLSNGPNRLMIRCRAKSTELALQFPSDLNVPKAGELQFDYQIDDQPSVKQRWTWLADRKIATYKGDPVPLLQSIPEGARLMIRASESGDTQQTATFLLIGLDSVRTRVGRACKWAPQQAGTSAPKR